MAIFLGDNCDSTFLLGGCLHGTVHAYQSSHMRELYFPYDRLSLLHNREQCMDLHHHAKYFQRNWHRYHFHSDALVSVGMVLSRAPRFHKWNRGGIQINLNIISHISASFDD